MDFESVPESQKMIELLLKAGAPDSNWDTGGLVSLNSMPAVYDIFIHAWQKRDEADNESAKEKFFKTEQSSKLLKLISKKTFFADAFYQKYKTDILQSLDLPEESLKKIAEEKDDQEFIKYINRVLVKGDIENSLDLINFMYTRSVGSFPGILLEGLIKLAGVNNKIDIMLNAIDLRFKTLPNWTERVSWLEEIHRILSAPPMLQKSLNQWLFEDIHKSTSILNAPG